MAKFQPGQSGNPGGRPKADVRLRDLARARTKDAIATLARIAKDKKAPAAARVRAAEAILDRGWGCPIQATAFVDSDGNDRPLPEEQTSALERARRIGFVLQQGLRAAAAAAQPDKDEDDDLSPQHNADHPQPIDHEQISAGSPDGMSADVSAPKQE